MCKYKATAGPLSQIKMMKNFLSKPLKTYLAVLADIQVPVLLR
jgi:hypothetical protein